MTAVFAMAWALCLGSAIACYWRASDAKDEGDLLAFDRWTHRANRTIWLGVASAVATLASLGGWLDELVPVGFYVVGAVLVVAGTVCIAAVVRGAKEQAS